MTETNKNEIKRVDEDSPAPPCYRLGYASCYIQEHKFNHLCTMPVKAAVEWVKEVCPNVVMGRHTPAADLTVGGDIDTDALVNGWLNKLFILVANDHGKWIALVNWDGRYSMYVER